MLNMHNLVYHYDVECTLNHLWNEYWVMKGKQGVIKVMKHCITCKYLNTKPVLPIADLPSYRVNRNHTFEIVGALWSNILQKYL